MVDLQRGEIKESENVVMSITWIGERKREEKGC